MVKNIKYEDWQAEYYPNHLDELNLLQQELIKSCLNDKKISEQERQNLIEEINQKEEKFFPNERIKVSQEKKDLIKSYLYISFRNYNMFNDKIKLLKDIFDIIKWHGITKFAKKIGISRVGLYDALVRENANPGFETLNRIFNGLNLKLKLDAEEI